MFTLTDAEKQSLRRRQNTASFDEKRQREHIYPTGRGYYKVHSLNPLRAADIYNVSLNRSSTYPNGHCTCPDFMHRRFPKGETCKHIDSCLLWFGVEHCETPAEKAQREREAAMERTAARIADEVNKKLVDSPEQIVIDALFAGARPAYPRFDVGPLRIEPLVTAEAPESPAGPRFDTITTIALPASLETVLGLLELAKRLTTELSKNLQATYDRYEVRPVVSTINGEHVSTIGVVGVRKES